MARPILAVLSLPGLLWLAAAPLALAGAAEPGIEDARRLAAAGDHAGAEAVYDDVLRREPGRADARLGRGQVRSYQRKFDGAEADFQKVLADDPSSLAALTGLGFTLSWSGQLPRAEGVFRRALEVSPGQPDAEKGLAYAALWQGQASEAARRFESAARRQPANAELQAGLGQALRAGGRRDEAGRAFARALELDPHRDDARQGLLSVSSARSLLDLTLLGSLTAAGGRNEPGLRFAEVAFYPGGDARAWLQYDDSLSLDSPGLARAGKRIPTLYAGGLVHYLEVHTTRLEGGWRRLEGGVDQWIVRAEQVLALREDTLLKAGAWLGPRSDHRLELVGHAGLSLPVAARLRLEPVVFYGQTGLAGERDLRALLAAQVGLASGLELSGGAGAGRSFRPAPASDGTPVSVFAGASLPLGPSLRARALASREWPASGPAITVLALGFTAALGGKP